jgi:alginate O-acetyltransferase complex protein AlgI
MLFSSVAFFPFLAATLMAYWGLTAASSGERRRVLQHALLVAASYWFYMSWNAKLLVLIVGTTCFDWLAARFIDRATTPPLRKLLLAASVLCNLGVLGLFKYANFFLDNVNAGAAVLGVHLDFVVNVVLPVGISFYTFESLSYVVDVYQRRISPIRSVLDYAVFISFFPHLVAGPIVRVRDFAPQLARAMTPSDVDVRSALYRFMLGMTKKVLISDHLAAIADPVFANPAAYGTGAVWAGVLAYAIQIYCDFSGYTDMAIGVALLFGYRLPENFDMPYLARNVTEFWHRWHISLSTWLRDYLFVPLGGSRTGPARTRRNLLLVMLLGGLWHGANWTFIVWGAWHGLGLLAHKEWTGLARGREPFPALPPSVRKGAGVAVTLMFVLVGWVFFRAPTLGAAGRVLLKMFVIDGTAVLPLTPALVAALLAMIIGHALGTRGALGGGFMPVRLPSLALAAVCGLFIAALFLFTPDGTQPFIYFQF